ncbi:MAG: hypothetical protein HY815_07680 [Candidatus Riflebacteria bacterium]|nr:hypothetical protein [Candidatus Riflebacteria bacterium]
MSVIKSDREMEITLARVARFQAQLTRLRRTETIAANYHKAASGYLSEIDRMQLEVREYLELHPSEMDKAA